MLTPLPPATAHSQTTLGTNASTGECSPVAPARVLGSTMRDRGLSKKRLSAEGEERIAYWCDKRSEGTVDKDRGD